MRFLHTTNKSKDDHYIYYTSFYRIMPESVIIYSFLVTS